MRALGRPVFGWSNDARLFADRTREFCGADSAVDAAGLLIEDFGLADNLMIDGAIAASGGQFIRHACAQGELWSDLSAFRACLDVIAKLTA